MKIKLFEKALALFCLIMFSHCGMAISFLSDEYVESDGGVSAISLTFSTAAESLILTSIQCESRFDSTSDPAYDVTTPINTLPLETYAEAYVGWAMARTPQQSGYGWHYTRGAHWWNWTGGSPTLRFSFANTYKN